MGEIDNFVKNNHMEFVQKIKKHPKINAAYIEFPFSVEEIFGKKGQIKVKVIFDNLIEYRGSLAKMGTKCHTLGIVQSIMKDLNKNFGDEIRVKLEEDTEERIVEIPEDIRILFNDNEKVAKLYNSFSYTKRKEFIRWIENAKKPETRERRKQRMIEMILEGKSL